MDYKDLPLDQRLELASQYALLLVADNKLTSEIIEIIRSDYALTEEQAAQAVGAMRKNYKNEYDINVRNNFLKAFGALGVSLMAFLFYYFIGKEMGSAGILFIILAFVFGLGGVGALLGMGSIMVDKLSKPATAARKLSEFDKVLQGIAFMSGFVLCLAAYEFFFQPHFVDKAQVVTINNCIITQPVNYKHTGGKNRSYYYVLKLRGSNVDFHFKDNYYKYSNTAWLVSELKQFDTVSIQLLQKDTDLINNKYNTGAVDILNVGLNGHFLVDHDSRNAKVHEEDKNVLYISLYIFLAAVAIILVKMGIRARADGTSQ